MFQPMTYEESEENVQ